MFHNHCNKLQYNNIKYDKKFDDKKFYGGNYKSKSLCKWDLIKKKDNKIGKIYKKN